MGNQESVLPPEAPSASPGLVVGVGVVVALIGAAAWALVRHLMNSELGILAWGIGVGVGAAMVRFGAATKPHAMLAGVLALASIVGGKYASYRVELGKIGEGQVQHVNAAWLDSTKKEADAWVALGDSPSAADVEKFVKDNGYEFTTADEFRSGNGSFLRWVATAKPDVDGVKAHICSQLADLVPFTTYVREDFHVLDVVFLLLGISSAYGLVMKAAVARAAAAAAAAAPDQAS